MKITPAREQDQLSDPHVLGQMYDYMQLLRNGYGVKQVFGILTSMPKVNQNKENDDEEEISLDPQLNRCFFGTCTLSFSIYTNFHTDQQFANIFVSFLLKLMRVEYSTPIIEHGHNPTDRLFLLVNEDRMFWVRKPANYTFKIRRKSLA